MAVANQMVDSPSSKSVAPCAKIKLELADGTWLETSVVQTKPMFFDESTIEHLKIRATPLAFYYVIQVPDGFSIDSVYLGVNVLSWGLKPAACGGQSFWLKAGCR
jgi:hypothetical protein